jgi:hypothetical protein
VSRAENGSPPVPGMLAIFAMFAKFAKCIEDTRRSEP